MDIPENPTSGGRIHVTWSSVPGDPPVVRAYLKCVHSDLALKCCHRVQYTLELANVIFRNNYAISNNVDTSLHELDVVLPVVPLGYVALLFNVPKSEAKRSLSSDGYTLQAVNIGSVPDKDATPMILLTRVLK